MPPQDPAKFLLRAPLIQIDFANSPRGLCHSCQIEADEWCEGCRAGSFDTVRMCGACCEHRTGGEHLDPHEVFPVPPRRVTVRCDHERHGSTAPAAVMAGVVGEGPAVSAVSESAESTPAAKPAQAWLTAAPKPPAPAPLTAEQPPPPSAPSQSQDDPVEFF